MADFAEFASIVTEKIFVNVVAYADETGTHSPTGRAQGSEIAGVAGYVGWVDDWTKFCGDWQNTLDRYKVPYFHFSEFADRKNRSEDTSWAYYHWEKSKREQFLIELASVANKWTQNGFCIGGFFRVDHYHKEIPKWFQQLQPPFGLCFLLFYDALLLQIKKQWKIGGTQVVFVFDHNSRTPQWESLAHLYYNMARFHRDADGRMGSITFGDSKKLLPLQAADMIAYFIHQQLTNAVRGRPISQNSFWKSLGRNQENTNIQHCSREYLAGVAKELERRRRELLDAHAERAHAKRTNTI
jgi:hypothetical protein